MIFSNKFGFILETVISDRHRCRKTTVLSCHRCLIKTGVKKNEQHLNIDYNFNHQICLSKSKCLYSNNCLQFLKRAVPFTVSIK